MRGRALEVITAVGVVLLAGGCWPAEAPAEDRVAAPEPTLRGEDAAGEDAAEIPPPPATAVLDEAILAARRSAQLRVLTDDTLLPTELPPLPDGPPPGRAQPPLDGDPTGLPGFFVPLEIAEGDSPLAPLEAGLAELAAGTRTTPVRIALYGASGVAIDMWTGYVRSYLQARFGDGGPGIVAGAPPHKWSRHNDIALDGSKHWNIRNTFRLDALAADGLFGVMGQAMSTTNKHAWSQLEPVRGSPSATSLAYYEIHYLQQRGGGGFEVRLDGQSVATIETALALTGHEPQLGRHRIPLESGRAHELRIDVRGDGQVRLLGVVAETGTPGVVIDTLGVNGAKITDMLRWDHQLWAEHLQLRDPVLYVLAYGNNESVDTDVPIAAYARDYRTVLERFREALPEAGCLMIGPGDYPILEDGQPRPRPRLLKIREVQRELAPAYGCAYLDTLAVFGGVGSKAAWVAAGLGKDDYLHLTRRGYVRFGMAVGDALMQRFDWRALHRSVGADIVGP